MKWLRMLGAFRKRTLRRCKNGCGPLSEWFADYDEMKGRYVMYCYRCKWMSPWGSHEEPEP